MSGSDDRARGRGQGGGVDLERSGSTPPVHPLLETVPNFSEGRDPAFVRDVVEVMERGGVEVLDASSDPDHHRSVVTAVGRPEAVVRALTAAARLAIERIDLTRHDGCHPRVGALDVAPVIPLGGTPRAVAESTARQVGEGLASLGIPIWWYGWSSPGALRRLGVLRRGGFEALQQGFSPDQPADLPRGARGPHPTAGVTCVGARPLLLAWNVDVAGCSFEALRGLAAILRETGGGFEGLRTLALELPLQGRVQLSMNLEDVERRDPMRIFEEIERQVRELGGQVMGTEVIGLIPDALVFPAAARRLQLLDARSDRLLSSRLVRHLIHGAPVDR